MFYKVNVASWGSVSALEAQTDRTLGNAVSYMSLLLDITFLFRELLYKSKIALLSVWLYQIAAELGLP